MGLPEMEGTRAFCGPPIRVATMSGTLLGKAQILARTDFCGVFSDAAVGPKAGVPTENSVRTENAEVPSIHEILVRSR
jgi:hypothetical protein